MRLLGAMTVMLYMVDGSNKTVVSTWNSYVGGLIRTLCFHPNTPITLKKNFETHPILFFSSDRSAIHLEQWGASNNKAEQDFTYKLASFDWMGQSSIPW